MQTHKTLLSLKLERFAKLTAADKAQLDALVRPVESAVASVDLIREGDKPDAVFLIVEGFACRYKITSTGDRHIMAYLIPGDLCDLHVFMLREMDHCIGTLSPCKFVRIPHVEILTLLDNPRLARALMCAALVDAAVLREWLVNIGRRTAEERIAHLFCELLLRMRAVGLAKADSYELPITQNEIAETMGLSDVHVNRVLQSLRRRQLITLGSKTIVILDIGKLNDFCGFNPNYLHLDQTGGSAIVIP